MKNALRTRQRMFAVALPLTAAQESTDSDFTVRSRASGLPLLGPEDSEVAADLEKVKFGKKLSPVLHSRFAVMGGGRLPPSLCELPLERKD